MRAMRDCVLHRGPDSAGEFVDGNAALGVRRLRIIDLVRGDQPQANEDHSVWTVFNGEIYNFHELRETLCAQGHSFVTSSDTEVIVHLYEEHGEAFIERLDGMFALAVWDTRRRTLLLARDRLGKKPLLYCEGDGELVFASEHLALLAGLARKPDVSAEAIRLYLRLGYVPAPHSAFAGVRKLEPGRVLVWRDGASRTRQYWQPPSGEPIPIEEAEAVSEVRRLVERAVSRRLVADVPLGAFLSGGIDSSCVVATMAGLETKVRTFTIAFAEREFSEAEHARRVARHFGTEHHEFVVGPGELDVLPLLVRHYGEPYADSSAVPTYYLSKLTRQHVTVALNGDGGDEVFAGYDRYAAMRLAELTPSALRPFGRLAAHALPRSAGQRSTAGRARRFLEGLSLPRAKRYLRWSGLFDSAHLASLLNPEFATATAQAELGLPAAAAFAGNDAVRAAQLVDMQLYLPNDLLVKVDIASMANSLEVRSPLLDRELVEFVMRLPTSLKLRNGKSKHVLRRAFADRLPAETRRRVKQGFGLPISAWFRSNLGTYAREILHSPAARTRGYFRPDRIEMLVGEYLSGRADHTHRLWSLLMLELWHREVVESPTA